MAVGCHGWNKGAFKAKKEVIKVSAFIFFTTRRRRGLDRGNFYNNIPLDACNFIIKMQNTSTGGV